MIVTVSVTDKGVLCCVCHQSASTGVLAQGSAGASACSVHRGSVIAAVLDGMSS